MRAQTSFYLQYLCILIIFISRLLARQLLVSCQSRTNYGLVSSNLCLFFIFSSSLSCSTSQANQAEQLEKPSLQISSVAKAWLSCWPNWIRFLSILPSWLCCPYIQPSGKFDLSSNPADLYVDSSIALSSTILFLKTCHG